MNGDRMRPRARARSVARHHPEAVVWWIVGAYVLLVVALVLIVGRF